MVGGAAGEAGLGAIPLRAAVAAIVAAGCLGGGARAAAEQVPLPTPDAPASSPSSAPTKRAAGASSLSRADVRRELRAGMRAGGGSSGAWFFDTGARGKPLLFTRNARSGRILASNQKLFTTAAILDRFGASKRFETAVYARGKRIGDGRQVLDGNLILRGDGDPALARGSFASRRGLPLTRIRRLAVLIREAGIRTVRGDLRADDSIFDRRRGIPATGYRAGTYLSPLSGLSFNSGYGSNGYARNPELNAARALNRALRAQGVRVRGRIGRRALPRRVLERIEPIATVSSPTLGRLAAATNKPSNNFFAEMLLKRLAAGPNRQGTTPRGTRRLKRFAKRNGTSVRASDGSGLGRGNRATPRQVGRLLRAMNNSEHRLAFRRSLAIAGRDGTLAGRMRGTAAEGSCRAKTGTLTGVSTLSGYCLVDGDRIIFSILMNGVDLTRARNAQDRMLRAVARYRR